jgi:hypothetical protein
MILAWPTSPAPYIMLPMSIIYSFKFYLMGTQRLANQPLV